MKKTILTLLMIWSYTMLFSEIPAGYYHKADRKKGTELLNTLNEICSNGNFLGYGSGIGYTWEGFHYTDRNEDGSVRDMYSSTIRYQKGFEAVDGMHIEHSLPKSWWGAMENYAYRDLHHLFPADATTNITKNNLPLGIVGEASFDNGVSKIGENSLTTANDKCFEPADEYKGDFARAYLYIATTYNELSELWDSPMMDNNNYPVWKEWAIELLMKWHREDPVSAKEKERQEAIYKIQHNRNPYIDYPEMAEHIWGEKKNDVMILPEETRPYFVSPNEWTKVEMPIAMVGTSSTDYVKFEGANFTKDIKLDIKHGSKEISISDASITPEEISTGKIVKIEVRSEKIETITDTMRVMTETDTMEIAINATFTDEFMMTKAEAIGATEAETEWTALEGEGEYTIKIGKGYPAKAGDIFISNYVEGTGYNKAISLYNSTGRDVDLKYFSIKKQGNGTGEMCNELKLTGKIKDGESFVIVNAKADAELKKLADITTTTNKEDVMNFNGNDAIGLFHNGIMTDVVGDIGNSDNWGENMTLRRKAYVNTPSSTYENEEWEKLECNVFEGINKHMTETKAETDKDITYRTKEQRLSIEGLIPGTRYNVSVSKNGKNTVNTIVFVTENLRSPEAYEATEIYSDRFTANWEDVSHAEEYIVEIAEISGMEKKIVEENFDNIDSKGKPLPEGWSGNVSGNYTSAASSGKAPNSVGMKNDEEWIMTPKHEADIVEFEFMYRFPSSATGSYFTVSAIDEHGVEKEIIRTDYESTKKVTLKLDGKKLGRGCRAVKIVYHKAKGNLAIDDIIYSYGSEEMKIIKSMTTTENGLIIEGLSKNSRYAYRVAATVKHGTTEESRSEWSNIIKVATNAETAPVAVDKVKQGWTVYSNGKEIRVTDMSDVKMMEVLDMQGRRVYAGTDKCVVMEHQGIYIVRLITNKDIRTTKVIIK